MLLYCSIQRARFRRKHQHYAELFGLQALLETSEGIEVRAPEDLTRSVPERAAAGTLSIELESLIPPPGKNLVVQVCSERLVIRTRPGVAPGLIGKAIPAALLGSGLAALVLHVVALPGDGWSLLLGLGLALVVAGAGASVLARGVRHELQLTEREVCSLWRLPVAGAGWLTRIPAEQVNAVLPHRRHGPLRRTGVEIIGQKDTIHFAHGVSRPEQRWVRDCVVGVLAKGVG